MMDLYIHVDTQILTFLFIKYREWLNDAMFDTFNYSHFSFGFLIESSQREGHSAKLLFSLAQKS